jgi:hypothetical protein
MVVKVPIAREANQQLRHAGVVVDVEVLVLDRAPQSLHENVVKRTPPPIHAHANALGLQPAGEGLGGELRPLIRVEDLRLAELPRVLQSGQAKRAVEGIGHLILDPVVKTTESPK